MREKGDGDEREIEREREWKIDYWIGKKSIFFLFEKI